MFSKIKRKEGNHMKNKPEVIRVEKKIGIKELIYSEFLKSTKNNQPLPNAEKIMKMLLDNGIKRENMVIKKIKNHYSFYKSKWMDIVEYGKFIYLK